jgi:hypothetical protein
VLGASAIATLGIVAATAGAHPGGPGAGPAGERVAAGEQGRGGERGPLAERPRRGPAASCEITDAERDAALSDRQNERLAELQERMKERSGESELTERQRARLERKTDRMVIRSVRTAAKSAPVLALFGAEDKGALRQMVRDADGMRALIENDGNDATTVEAYREAKRQGRQDAREAVERLCAGDDEDGGPDEDSAEL